MIKTPTGRFLATAVGFCLVSFFSPNVNRAEESDITFEKHIRPILKAHCFHCHGEDGVKEANLDLRLKRFMISGGDSGAVLTPGNISKSLLVEKIESGEMPPEKKPIPTADLELIKNWIKQGAKTAREEPETISNSHLTLEDRGFWSFQPIQRPTIPPVQNGLRTHSPVDHFIIRKLAENKLSLSPTASRTTLIRRLYFDLLGLPPTPKEIDRFLKDDSAGAVEKLIDRLLSSPNYGERWGRHWLDVAGYADSEGFTDKDPEREFAFFYRDYVVKSFNDGKPFNQFIIEQIAGDELIDSPLDQLTQRDQERLMATGFLRMAPDGTASGGVDRAVAANESVADTINIVSTSLLGLTVGCARCHNHRYDPISQVDYYRMRAVFEPALDWKSWKTPRQRQVSLYTKEQHTIRQNVEAEAKKVEAERQRKQAAHIERTLYEELLVAPDEKRDALRKAFKTSKANRTKEQISLLEEFPNIQNISNGSLYLYAEQRNRRANEIKQEGQRRADGAIERIRAQHLKLVAKQDLQKVQTALSTENTKWSAAQKEIVAKYPNVFVTIENLNEISPRDGKLVNEYFEAAERCRKLDAKTELANLASEAARIRSTAPKEYFVRALVEPQNHVPDTFLFKRGSHNQPAQKVLPGDLEIVGLVAKSEVPINETSKKTTGRRLAYARNLTHPRHPLVARVIVNRIWMHHFGKGLVATAGDFGYLGAKPTHPDLLDWLATEFIASGWDLKTLHRLILSSATYQQQSGRTERLDQFDPDNLLYGRQSIRRLESEAIRDTVLFVSGSYVNRMHGPPIPVKEDAVGQIVLGKQKLDGERKPQPGHKLGGEAERRSIYIQVRRTRPLAVLESFDIATNSPNCAKRHYSNVAPQSLMLINSDFMVRYSQRFSDRLIRQFQGLDQQISQAYRFCYARKIDTQTLETLRAFVEGQAQVFKTSKPKLTDPQARRLGLANLCHA